MPSTASTPSSEERQDLEKAQKEFSSALRVALAKADALSEKLLRFGVKVPRNLLEFVKLRERLRDDG